MPNPIISILLPVKNEENHLRECLDSILEQTESNWELIAVDDHSSDSSYQILKTYSQNDSRISVFKNEEAGIITALRKAYSYSKGMFISRMDADDIMTPHKLEKLKTRLVESGLGHLSTGLVSYFSNEKLGDGYQKYQTWLNDLSLQENNFSNIYKECVIPSPCWMVYREDLDRCGAFNSNTYPEDYDLCFRFYKYNLKIKTVPEVLHRWRDYAERTSRNDPHYADVHFFDLKIQHFLNLDYKPQKQLIIWGTGKKGKKLAKILINNNIMFGWLTDNPKKIGKDIYGIRVESIEKLRSFSPFQVIIAVAAKDAKSEIDNIQNANYLGKSEEFFLFC